MGATNILIEKVKGGLEAYKLHFRAYPTPVTRAGMTKNESLYFYLTTAFRNNPVATNGEIPGSINAGPMTQFNEQESTDLAKTGNRTIIDSWRTPLHVDFLIKTGDPDPRTGNVNNPATWQTTQTIVPNIYSCGPNLKDDGGIGDDIVYGK